MYCNNSSYVVNTLYGYHMLQVYSSFNVVIYPQHDDGAFKCDIKLVENPSRALKYDNGRNIVIIDEYNEDDLSFKFTMKPVMNFQVTSQQEVQ